jgi:tetratricopeptide (TPR) repeat protein
MDTQETDQPDFDALWDYNNPAATEQQFRVLLAQAERSGKRDYHVQLLTQLARALGLQRRFAEAHATLDAATTLVSPDLAVAGVRLALERGRLFNSAGEPDAARPFFQAAWEAAQAAGDDGYAVDAAHMLAIVSPPAEKLAWEQRALALAETSPQPRARKWLASLYNNMGWSCHALGQHEQALAMFERALAERESAGDPASVAVARWCVGRGLRALGRYPEALAAQQALAADLAARGEQDGYVDEELGENLLALGRAEEARPCFARAYATLAGDAWLAAHEPARLARLRELGARKDE